MYIETLLDLNESVSFLNEIIKKVDTPETKDVYVLALMESAQFKLKLNQTNDVKKAIDESEKILDGFDSVDTAIYANFYRVSAEYYKVKAVNDRIERAYDLSLSALLGDMIYNFGELVSVPSALQSEFMYKRFILL